MSVALREFSGPPPHAIDRPLISR